MSGRPRDRGLAAVALALAVDGSLGCGRADGPGRGAAATLHYLDLVAEAPWCLRASPAAIAPC